MSIGYEGLGDLGSQQKMTDEYMPLPRTYLYVVVRKVSDGSSFNSRSDSNVVHYLTGDAALKTWIESNPVVAKSARIFRAEELEFKLELTLTEK